MTAWLDRRADEMIDRGTEFGGFKIRNDPEGIFQEGWLLCDVGEFETGLGYLRRAVSKGYFVGRTLSSRPQFDLLRNVPTFREMLQEAEPGRHGRSPPSARLLGIVSSDPEDGHRSRLNSISLRRWTARSELCGFR